MAAAVMGRWVVMQWRRRRVENHGGGNGVNPILHAAAFAPSRWIERSRRV